MRKLSSMGILFLVFALSVPANATSIDISVTPEWDRMFYWDWSSYGRNDIAWIVNANPNQVSHAAYSDFGSVRETALRFDLSPFTGNIADIASASFNFKILNIWTDGRDDVGNLNNVGTVYYSGGTGWKSFDITDSLKNTLASGSIFANFYFSYTGNSGFAFASAEGGSPAYLRIVMTETDSVANSIPETVIPEPATMLLLGLGLVGVVGARRKGKSLR